MEVNLSFRLTNTIIIISILWNGSQPYSVQKSILPSESKDNHYTSFMLLNCLEYVSMENPVSLIIVGNISLDTNGLKFNQSHQVIILSWEKGNDLSARKQSGRLLNSLGVIIIFLETLEPLRELIHEEIGLENLNPKVIVVIIYVPYVQNVEKTRHLLFNATWKERLLNVVLIVRTRNANKQYLSQTSNSTQSFQQTFLIHGFINNPVTNTTHVVNLNEEPAKGFAEVKKILPLRIQNLKGSPLLISTIEKFPPILRVVENKNGKFQYQGQFGQMFEMLIKCMNFTPIHSSFSRVLSSPIKLANGTWTSHLGDLANGRAEFVLQTIVINQERYESFKFPPPFYISSMLIVVHEPRPLPKWMNIYLPFLPETWLITFAVLIVVYVTTNAVKYMNNNSMDMAETALVTFSIFLQVSVNQPRKCLERYVFYLLVYFSLIMTSLYNGCLLSYLTIPRFYPEIKTFKDAVDAGIIVISHEAYLKRFKVSANPFLRKLYENSRVPEPGVSDDDQFKLTPNGAIVTTQYVLPHLPNLLASSKKCTYNICALQEFIGLIMSSFCVNKNFPFIERVSDIILKCVEAGLANKWYDDSMKERLKGSSGIGCNYVDNIILSLQELYSSFVILCIGLTFAVVAFLVEKYKNGTLISVKH